MGRRSSAAVASPRPGSSSGQDATTFSASRAPSLPKRTPRRLKQPDATPARASPPSRRRNAARQKEQGEEAAGKQRGVTQLDGAENRLPAAEQPSNGKSRHWKNARKEALKEKHNAGGNGDEEEGEEGEESEEDKGGPKALGEGFYELETVKGKRIRKGKLQYLVKWQGWPESANTWEPYDNLKDCDDIIQNFEESHKTKAGRRKRKSGAYLSSQKKKHVSGPAADEDASVKVMEEDVEEPVHSKMDPKVSGGNIGISGIANDSNSEKLKADNNAIDAIMSADNDLEAHQNKLPLNNETLPKDVMIDGIVTPSANGHCTLKGKTLTSDIGQQDLLQYATRSTYEPELTTVNKEDSGKKRLERTHIIEDEDSGKLVIKEKQTGVRKRKQELDRLVREDLEFQEHGKMRVCKEEGIKDIEQINVDSKVVNGGISEAQIKRIQNVEIHSQSCENLDIVEIIKAVSYSSSTANSKQDVAVLFKATRSDGREVMVDNKFLRSNHPLLLLDFYEQHLRYSTTQ